MFLSHDALANTSSWRGEIVYGQFKIPLVFNFNKIAQDSITCTLDSPSQGVKGIATNVILYTADSVAIDCKMIGANYRGNIKGDSICGKFTQRGVSFPLTLKQEEPLSLRRPQTPVPPYPYNVIDTVFQTSGNIKLAASLTFPKGKSGNIPAVVMITGSGPQNRDEEIFDHKPFAVIADYLARNGIASLRYDDRGIDKSSGDFVHADINDFKDDALNGIDFLRSLPDIGKVGVLGHSEGGTIAFMIGSEKAADFIISLAGMTVSGKETILQQNSKTLDKAGISGVEKVNSLKLVDCFFDTMIKQKRSDSNESVDIDSLINVLGITVPAAVVSSLKVSQKGNTSEFESLLALDPSQFISNVKCPVLAINGEKDTQVEAKSNTDIIRNNVPNAEIYIMPGLNHLMQHCTTGEVSEYGEIRETISPEVLQKIVDFIQKLK